MVRRVVVKVYLAFEIFEYYAFNEKGLENGLKKNFRQASVTVVPCPDLTQSPWGLAASGLGGNTR